MSKREPADKQKLPEQRNMYLASVIIINMRCSKTIGVKNYLRRKLFIYLKYDYLFLQSKYFTM